MNIEIKRKKAAHGLSKGIEYTHVYVDGEEIGTTRNWRRNCWEVTAPRKVQIAYGGPSKVIAVTKSRDEAIAAILRHHLDPEGFEARQAEQREAG
jgi:hypothetical protein